MTDHKHLTPEQVFTLWTSALGFMGGLVTAVTVQGMVAHRDHRNFWRQERMGALTTYLSKLREYGTSSDLPPREQERLRVECHGLAMRLERVTGHLEDHRVWDLLSAAGQAASGKERLGREFWQLHDFYMADVLEELGRKPPRIRLRDRIAAYRTRNVPEGSTSLED